MNEELRGYHEVANIFPLLNGQEYEDLKADIAANGLLEPIWLHQDGRIIDGRNRYRACCDLGIPFTWRLYEGEDDNLVGFVVSLNLKRRHLNESQRQMVAARIANMPQGYRSDVQPSANLPKVSQEQAAGMLNVSPRGVRNAKAVQEKGTPELNDAVDRGDVSASAAADVATLPPEEQQAIISIGPKEVVKAAKKVREKRREQSRRNVPSKEPSPLPAGKYRVIYADPPWAYNNSGFDQSAEEHYPTMPVDDICALPVADLAGDQSVLYLWATVPLLPDALRVMMAWGFEYKTHRIWYKDRAPGLGWWGRTYHEVLLIGAHGEGVQPSKLLDSVVSAPVGRHSQKPDCFRQDIESVYPGPYVELFARETSDGWDSWGNEI